MCTDVCCYRDIAECILVCAGLGRLFELDAKPKEVSRVHAEVEAGVEASDLCAHVRYDGDVVQHPQTEVPHEEMLGLCSSSPCCLGVQ